MLTNLLIRIISFFSLCHLAFGNTETYQFHVPKDFPELSQSYVPKLPYINAQNTTFGTITTHLQPEAKTFVELTGLQKNENYMVKICWTGIDPISLKSIRHQFIPHGTVFEGTLSTQTRAVILIETTADSYPLLQEKVKVDVNLAVIKLGIPVDMYSILFYLACVIICAISFIRAIDPFQLLEVRKQNKSD
ncbi:Pga1 [Kluyveromyces lactis]|nr:Pga1 [Kluyveromyces lactis]